MAEEGAPAKRRVPVIAMAAILVLSLLTYWFFNQQAMPLDKASSAVVVGLWTAIVLISRWIWLAFVKRRNLKPRQERP